MTGRDKDDQWDDEENLVLPEQPMTWCYTNPRGQIVIRQETVLAMHQADDSPFIVVSMNNVPSLVRALVRLYQLSVDFGPCSEVERLGEKVDGDTIKQILAENAVLDHDKETMDSRTPEPSRDASPSSRPSAAALRQQRYRERHRQATLTPSEDDRAPPLFDDAAE